MSGDGPTDIYCPADFDLQPILARLSSAALEYSPEYRRMVTRLNPLLFALTYVPHHLSSPDTGNRLSFSRMHIDMCRGARRWIRHDLGPGELREAWICPRGSGKSTFLFLVLPLWAMAHGHRNFIMAFSNASSQAKGHLGTLVRELSTNAWLRADYPELCTPKISNSELYLAESGAAIAAKGIDASTLGVKIGNRRPDCLLLDDVSPDASNYDATTRTNRLSTITNAIFPMSLNAVVQWAATVTIHGSLEHDLVRHATDQGTEKWIAEHGIRVRYYPAIVVDEHGKARSLWPQRWRLRWLLSIRDTRMYQLNYANNPVGEEDGSYWTPDMFRLNPRFPIEAGVLSIDPAVSAGKASDYTGYAVVAVDPSGRRACVTHARALKIRPGELGKKIAETLAYNDWITTVILEKNQGGDTWAEILGPHLKQFPRVKLEVYHSHESKAVRYAAALAHYEAGRVDHFRELSVLQGQCLAAPNNLIYDDVLDAAVAGIRYYLDAPRALR